MECPSWLLWQEVSDYLRNFVLLIVLSTWKFFLHVRTKVTLLFVIVMGPHTTGLFWEIVTAVELHSVEASSDSVASLYAI